MAKCIRTDRTKNFDRCRKFAPSKCKSGTFRTKKVSSRVEVVLCRRKGNRKQSVQTVLTRRF